MNQPIARMEHEIDVVVPTFCKWVRIVDVVFEPETISELEIAKLSGYDASERGSKNCSVVMALSYTGRPQIDVIHVSAECTKHTYRLCLVYKRIQLISMATHLTYAKRLRDIH